MQIRVHCAIKRTLEQIKFLALPSPTRPSAGPAMSFPSTERLPTIPDDREIELGKLAYEETRLHVSEEPHLDPETSVDLSLKSAGGHERLRRRSERPSNAASIRPVFDAAERESFELSAVPPHLITSERVQRRSETSKVSHTVQEPVIEPSIQGDGPETMPSSYATTPTASLRVEAMEVDDRSMLSPAERQRQKRNGWMHFAAVCWVFFLNGGPR
jgi:hypothetical protein